MKKLGEYLKQTRESYGLSVEDVAKATGYHEQLIEFYERGQREIPLDFLLQLTQKLSINWIKTFELYRPQEEVFKFPSHLVLSLDTPEKFNDMLGDRIAYIRKCQRLTQEEFAIKSGVSSSTISSIERGCCSLTLTKLKKLCDALNVSVANLFSELCLDEADTLFVQEFILPCLNADSDHLMKHTVYLVRCSDSFNTIKFTKKPYCAFHSLQKEASISFILGQISQMLKGGAELLNFQIPQEGFEKTSSNTRWAIEILDQHQNRQLTEFSLYQMTFYA